MLVLSVQIETCVIEESGNSRSIMDIEKLCLKNSGHVPGFISVSAGEKKFFGEEYETDIFFWWAQVPLMLEKIVCDGVPAVEGYFPDLPLSMLWQVNGDKIVWSISGRQSKSIRLPRRHFTRLLHRKCSDFFEKMQTLAPAFPGGYSAIIRTLAKSQPLIDR